MLNLIIEAFLVPIFLACLAMNVVGVVGCLGCAVVAVKRALT